LAKKLGITGTPSFAILNNDMIESILPGAIPYETFEKTISAIG
jgi:protein-disulfide isomerase